jgi:hypothetical protein
VLVVFSALTIVALAGLPLLRNNTDLVRFLKASAPLRGDTLAVSERLTGPNTLDFVVRRRDGRPLTRAADLARLAAFATAATRHAHVSGVTSVVPVLMQLQAAEEGGGPRLPDDDASTAYLFDLLAAADDPGLLRKLVAPDARSLRVNVRVEAVGTAVAAPLAATMLAEGRGIFGTAYAFDATGAFYRVALDSNDLVAAQVRSFGTALLLVFAAIGLLFRSLRLVVVVAVANLMPIIWTGGLMGMAGIDLSAGTAMIASSVLGLVVDDTIHYLTAFRRAPAADVVTAVRHAAREAGPALVVNNVVLIAGFWVGAFGSFEPTILFSVLSGHTMLTALLCDLLVTPACLVVLERVGGRTVARGAVAAAVLLVLSAGVGRAAEVSVAPALAPALVDAGERRWARTDVPDAVRKVGEVRLVTRGDADVVETILYTTLLRRAVREIRHKEMANWPPGASGHDDAERYVAALERVQQALDERADTSQSPDRRRRLLIEFVLLPRQAAIVLSRFESVGDEGADVHVTAREDLAVLEPSRAYVRRNMRLIVGDSFEVQGEALDRLLSPLREFRTR